jgi:hypothetical protein
MAAESENPTLLRDRHLLRLLELVARRPSDAAQAMKRLEAQTIELGEDLWKKNQAHARRTAQLLEVARELFLHPSKRTEVFATVSDPEAIGVPIDLTGFDEVLCAPGRQIPLWMDLVRKATGYVGPESGHEIGALRGIIEFAAEADAEEKFDVQGHTAAEAYLFARTKAGIPTEDALKEIDATRIKRPYMPVGLWMMRLLSDRLSETDIPRDMQQWWELGVLFLWLHIPDFDGTAVRASRPYPWIVDEEDDEYGWERCRYRGTLLKLEGKRGLHHHDVVLSRTVEYLSLSNRAIRLLRQTTPKVELPRTRRTLPDPSQSSIRHSVMRIERDETARRYATAEIMDLYGLTGVSAESFLKSRKYVAPRDQHPQPHQLPAPDSEMRVRNPDGSFGQAQWDQAEVLRALRGWEKKFDPASSPF